MIPGFVFVGTGWWLKSRHQIHVAEPLPDYSIDLYTEILQDVVRDGLVDYHKLGRKHLDNLNRFLDATARFGPTTTPDQFPTRNDQLAYYLNAYNALMMKQILRMNIPEEVSRFYFIATRFRVDKQWITLHGLEQDLIRPRFQDPRIHFALVCASRGCPPLRPEPYEGIRLTEQLEDQGRLFVAAPQGLTVKKGVLLVSAIFKWYEKDFESFGGIKMTLLRYIPKDDERRGSVSKAEESDLDFPPYDWRLNILQQGSSP